MGSMPTEMYASISWETTMLPSSVAMAVPDRAAMMKAVRMGPSSRVITTMRIEYRRLVWPNRGRMVPPSTMITAPMDSAIRETMLSASTPVKRICSTSTLNATCLRRTKRTVSFSTWKRNPRAYA